MAISAKSPKPTAVYKRPSFWQRLRSGNLTDTQLGIIMLLPAFLVLALVMFYPIINVLWQSLHFDRLNVPQRGTPFVGLDNFVRMAWGREMTWSLTRWWPWRLAGIAALLPLWLLFKRSRALLLWTALLLLLFVGLLGIAPSEAGRWNDARFWNAFGITLLIIITSVSGSFLLGLPLALLANMSSKLRWLVRVALLLPWAMPQALTGLMFAWLFQGQFGVFNDILGRLGVNAVLELMVDPSMMSSHGVLWLSRVTPAIIAVNATIIWKTSSFVGLILLAGLQSIDGSLYEAATVDGANSWQRFWRITLPLLKPSIAVAMIFRTLTAVQTFDIPFAMTGGGPGRALETLGIYIHSTTLALNIGYAAALSVALFLLSLGISILYLRWIYSDDN